MDENYDKKEKQSRVPKLEERYRTFIFILYPDAEDYDYNEVINYIEGEIKYYVYITHQPEKEESKVHTHVLVYFDNPRYADGLAKKLGINLNYINLPLSTRGYVRYMTHITYPEKIQYNINDLHISKSYLKNVYNYFNDEKLDIEVLDDIYQFIDDNSFKDPIQLEKELSLYVCSASYNRVFKMYYNTIVKYLTSKYRS